MTQHYICIHGHFYQPPRENPWLETIEIQDSAYPYHDWNARITGECYARNATARILDERKRIARITNNYERISFNFGPTLLSWMEEHAPDVYAAIPAADQHSRERFSGHGSALAQAYNHMILPLANTADRTTQILWGIRDFEYRFGRSPEGMWLPEAAVDLETLAIMAEMGIAFTVLSPYQANRIRPAGTEEWSDVSDGSLDPRRPYIQHLPNDRSIVVFFYDGPISKDVAFDGLLNNGEAFAGRLLAAFDDNNDGEDQLVHIAMDGETFGHHHRFGDMALAYALERIDEGDAARLTNYGEILEKWPPTWEAEIKENTAWSCSHGVGRWKSDCGCNSGGRPEWNQAWREPLRNALDGLRDALAEIFTENGGSIFTDPWQARNDYIYVILDRSDKNIDRFMKRHLSVPLDDATRIRALKLLEMQRQAMLMYTSCGWFFDELSGLETVQVIMYAGRAVQLAGELSDRDVEGPFLEQLALAKSNIPNHKDGRHIYEKWVKPASVDLKKAATHYAISSFYEDYPEELSIFCYEFENIDIQSAEAGKAKMAVGQVRVTSRITRETDQFQYAVLHMGDHNISCGINTIEQNGYAEMASNLLEIFDKSDIPRLFESLGNYFPGSMYSLTSLFRDEQRKVMDTVLEATTTDAIMMYRQFYDNHVFLMRFIHDSGNPIPKALSVAGEIVINSDLNMELGREALDFDAVRTLIDAAERAGIALNDQTLEYTLRRNLERMARAFHAKPEDMAMMEDLTAGLELAVELPFYVKFQEIQNVHYELKQTVYPDFHKKAAAGDDNARQWTTMFTRLADILKIRME